MLNVTNVKKRFNWAIPITQRINLKLKQKEKFIWAVNGISMKINQGDSFGLVGESGCGKTTLGKILIRLFPSIDDGRVEFDGYTKCLYRFSPKEVKEYRKKVQMIFQNPDASLNPQMTIGKSIKEAILLKRGGLNKKEIDDLIKEYLVMVNLSPDNAYDYPDDLSGGEKRRIGLIRALAVNPDLIIADEPFSGLDASVRNHLIDLLLKMQDRFTLLLISHDLGVVKYLCSQVAVMYLGKFVEIGSVERIVSEDAKHPYTKGLFAASNYQDTNFIGWEASTQVEGGCSFLNRCFLYKSLDNAQKRWCKEEEPTLLPIDNQQSVACHHWQKL